MHEFDFRRRRINPNAIIAFVLGVLVAYLITVQLSFGGGSIFVTLIVVAVGGLWYHIRNVV
jgi:hypothetical protein